VAAWKHYHGAASLGMWISRDGCDLNTPAGYQRAAEAIRGIDERPRLIVVDTVHRFLAGDENSAQDVKTMLDACAGLQREFGATVLLVHHTGVSEEAQHRARGSSAWRGALEIEISVIPPKGDGVSIQVVQRKAKDSEEVAPVWVELLKVEIPGWYDEDGEPVTSAVLAPSEAPPEKPKKESKGEGFRKMLEKAWFASQAEVLGGLPYVSRSAMLAYLESLNMSPRSAENACKPSETGRLIGYLINAGTIRAEGAGWVVCSESDAQALLLSRSQERGS
jgi:hypothetical protein